MKEEINDLNRSKEQYRHFSLSLSCVFLTNKKDQFTTLLSVSFCLHKFRFSKTLVVKDMSMKHTLISHFRKDMSMKRIPLFAKT